MQHAGDHGPTAPPAISATISVPKIEPKCGPSKISAAIAPMHRGRGRSPAAPARMHHHIEQRLATASLQQQQRDVADREAERSRSSRPISRPMRSERWPSAIWPGIADQAHEAERPGGHRSARSRSRRGIWSGGPAPRTRRTARRSSRARSTRTAPVRTARGSVQSIAAQAGSTMLDGRCAPAPASATRVAVGLQPDVLRAGADQQVDRHQHDQRHRPSVQHGGAPAVRAAIIDCSHGSSTIAPTPTPEKAMLMARPRRRTNQFGRNSDWPV